ncbi:MAG TPA: hypothetical protein VK966_13205, partial [Longimicrobiales bacterium]|nr:hypothetical protein [Longimicrobiales bacterium]
GGGLATLAVSDRESSRLLRFDSQGLQGRVDRRRGTVQEGRPRSGPCQDRAFAGIHVIAPELLDMLDAGTYSIMDTYLDLAGVGRRILPHDVSGALWLEIGNPERLARARKVVAERVSRPSGS